MKMFKKKKQMPGTINIVDVVKQAHIQLKYEEIGSWLAAHRTPLFYAHDKGFSVVDAKFIDKRKWLKDALTKMVKDIEKQKPKAIIPKTKEEEPSTGYIG